MGIDYNTIIVTDGLVGYWDAANTRSYSGSGFTVNGLINSLNANLTNGVGFTSSNNGSFTFDGVDDYLDFGNSSLVRQNSATISAWVKASSPGSNFRGIFAKQYAYGLFYLNSVLVIFDWSTGSTRTTGINIADGNWKNVALTFQSGVSNGSIIYLNGNPVLTTTMTVSDQTLGNLFGGAEANAGQYSNCSGSIFKIYNRPLSAQEVLQNFNATKKRYL